MSTGERTSQTARQGTGWSVRVLAAVGLAALACVAQERRCDWHGELVPGNSRYYKCLDIGTVNGSTVKVPRSVTRIGFDGISLCMNQVVKPGEADIIYLMDNTSSMECGCASIRGTDTAFHETGCGGTVVGKLTIPYKDGTRQINVVTGGSALSGDPYGQRAIVIKQAIKLQQQYCKTATAGFITFNSARQWLSAEYVGRRQRPLEITKTSPQATANIQTLFSKIWLDASGEPPLAKQASTLKIMTTDYAEPLDLAKRWLSADSGLTRTANKAIVLVSDGRPNDWSLVLPMIAGDPSSPGKLPPVYGIHLGSPSIGATLNELCSLTVGKFFVVPPTDTDSLQRVMSYVVGSIVKTSIPKTITVTNKSFTPPQTSYAVTSGLMQNPDGGWPLVLDQVVGLREGPNQIEVKGVFLDTKDNRDTTITFSLVIDVVDPDPAAYQSNITCYDPSRIEILSRSGAPVEYVTYRDTVVTVRLTTAAPPLPGMSVEVRSAQGSDRETVMLPATRMSADSAYVIYEKTIRFSVGATGAAGDGTIQSNRTDSLVATWTHPRDPRDGARTALAVEDPAVESPVANPPGDTFSCPLSITLTCATPGAAIWYTLDGTVPAENSGTSRKYTSGQMIEVAQTTTLKAVAVVPGFRPSRVLTETYTRLTVADIAALPPSKDYYGSLRVVLTTATAGARIWYTIDGSTPAAGAPNSSQFPDTGIVLKAPGSVTIKAVGEMGCYLPAGPASFTYVNKDAEGPFVKRAVFYPGTLPGQSEHRPDTLVILLNERVQWGGASPSPAQVLYYFRGSEGKSDVALAGSTILFTTDTSCAIVFPPGGFRVHPLADSVQLVGDMTPPVVTDAYGNTPSPDGRKAQIEWGIRYAWIPQAAPNPFIPGETELPAPLVNKVRSLAAGSSFRGEIPSRGSAIVITPLNDVEGSVTLYDQVGNIVVDRRPMVRDPESRALYFVWDGTNRNGRYVGSGTYVAEVVAGDGREWITKRVKVGVKR